jgi:predicted ATPase
MVKPVTDSNQLSRIELLGYKSIKECTLELGNLNIFIGANGAGKSNFISFFKLISQILLKELQLYVGRSGGPDALLHYGRKETEVISTKLYFGNNGYFFNLEATQDNRLMFRRESFYWNMNGENLLGIGHFESLAESGTGTGIDRNVLPPMKSWQIYHFHDTSDTAKVKQLHGFNDNLFLRQDASNLAAYLFYLKSSFPIDYKRIVTTIQLVAPFFGDFILRASPANHEKIELEWTEAGHDIPFKAHELSDGTLRFICLATVLLQPDELMPSTILIDEPELGLHPYAITVLASLIHSASADHQIIVSTQSVELINEFEVEDLVVVDRVNGASTFNRLNEKELIQWLDEYSLGELWKKNLLGGRPSK